MAIMTILVGIGAASFHSISSASSLSSAREAALAEFTQARQLALARRLPVEVRLYQLPSYEAHDTGSPTVFRAMQTFLLDPDAGTNAVDKVVYFPKPVIVSTNAAASPLLQQQTQTGSFLLPVIRANYRYIPILFNIDGLPASLTATNSFFTLVLAHAAIKAGNLPANFVTLQLDPLTGRIFHYAP